MSVPETVVLVHGLWVNGLDMSLLRRRLHLAGFRTFQFSYPSVRQSPRMNAMALNAYLQSIEADAVHLVGHSLGGLVIRHLAHDYPERRAGRVVTLGTPHRGSQAACRLTRVLPGRLALGKSMQAGLSGDLPPWPVSRELGVIAGTLRLGMGMVVPDIARPNDGTVTVEETRLAGMCDHITLPVTHFGLLLSGRAAVETAHFLHHGCFSTRRAGGAMRA